MQTENWLPAVQNVSQTPEKGKPTAFYHDFFKSSEPSCFPLATQTSGLSKPDERL